MYITPFTFRLHFDYRTSPCFPKVKDVFGFYKSCAFLYSHLMKNRPQASGKDTRGRQTSNGIHFQLISSVSS